ncbi:hypothetical protein FACS189451_03540 [Bacteroidia bacterium]|nr:hypothetical protein FACS189451_03540 [Bacteroidia bacterium]
MKRHLYYVTVLFFLSFISCLEEHEYNPTQDDINKTVNEWIYKTMYNYYYWEAELPSKPNYLENPDIFFKSLLFTPNDRFSWITENPIITMDLFRIYTLTN